MSKYLVSFVLVFFFFGCINSPNQSNLLEGTWEGEYLNEKIVLEIFPKFSLISVRAKIVKRFAKFNDCGNI